MNQATVETVRHPSGPCPGLVDFLNVQIRPKADFSIKDEYPSLFGEYPGGTSLVARINGLTAGHVGILAREFVGPSVRFKIGLIGSVVTAPEFRNHGVASLLLDRALKELKSRGCIVACLWSGEADFYEKFQFHRAGREVMFKFNQTAIPEDSTPSVEFDEKKHTHLIWRLYQRHTLRVDRSLEEQKQLVRIPKSRIYLTLKGTEVTSYIVVNKGADFTDYIHEWGGDLTEVSRNIAGTQKHHFKDRPLTLIAPASYDLTKLRALASEEGKGVLGLMHALDRTLLTKIYASFLRGQGVEFTSDGRIFRFQKDEYLSQSGKEALSLVFGDATEPRHPVMPFFLWGYDSI
ncbi:MAG: GNAT family N-acetyltransferase [Deltaproteobacteria bacterium]|nr:GNAT family N-acetyltransferase [Deltaproteobacteria bacterium]MBI3296118.1 GNAT family N-acetyltransferase [Deltaproteobacteria bacterium]